MPHDAGQALFFLRIKSQKEGGKREKSRGSRTNAVTAAVEKDREGRIPIFQFSEGLLLLLLPPLLLLLKCANADLAVKGGGVE